MDAGEISARFQHVGKEDELAQRAHSRLAGGVVADGVEHGGVGNAEGVFGIVGARVLVQDGRGHPRGGRKALQFGRGKV